MNRVEIRPLRWNEIDRAAEIGAYAWPHRTAIDRLADFGRRVDSEREVLVAVEDGQIVSQAHIHSFGTWIEGKRFSTGGFTNVVTVPERARRGYASQLLRASLAWMREELGHTLSTLYPTVFPLYNQLGWALAEDALHLSGAPSAFRPSPRLPVDAGSRVERRLAEISDVDLLDPIYRQFASPRVGYLDRPRWYWEDYVVRQRHGAEARWLVTWHGSDRQLAAYALYAFDRGANSAGSESRLIVRDLISLRPEGYQALLSFLSAHHLWNKVVVEGGRDVAWSSLVANPHELDVEAPLRSQVLLRIVDLQRAIEQRHVHPSVPASEVALQVHDDAAPWNAGIWRIVQRDGRWTCARGVDRTPDAAVDIATLAALFSGSLGTRQAIEGGLLRAVDAAVPTLEALFAVGYPPHSADHF